MQCFHPVRIRDPNNEGHYLEVPCGKCFACQSNRRRDWHMRIKYELLHRVCSYTVTLTYDNDHLPRQVLFKREVLESSFVGIKELDHVEEEMFMDSVGFWYHPYDITHVQKFFKRLRKDGLQFRYFGVAEYGGKTARPHYHIIFFFDKYISKINFQTKVVHHWPYGCQIVVDETNDNCIGYTLKYCLKFYNVQQPGPKIFLSKRPFIGDGYLSEETINYLRTHPGDVVQTVCGKQRLPRLIRNKVYDDDMKERNVELIQEGIELIQDSQTRISSSLGLCLDEYRKRLKDSFTRRCVDALKRKTL